MTPVIVEDWHKYEDEVRSQKCYVVTKDAVRYGDKPGVDSVTDRQCRLVTPEALERLREHEKGNRPKRITSAKPEFFNSRTAEPIVWYYKSKNGDIELFDLMGFYPETSDELLPITKEVVEAWKEQAQRQDARPKRAPNPIPLNKDTQFFDPLTGAPRIWYWL